jgi:hypothetical protein
LGDIEDDRRVLVSALRLELVSHDIDPIPCLPLPYCGPVEGFRDLAWATVRTRVDHIIGQRSEPYILGACVDLAGMIVEYGLQSRALRQDVVAWLQEPDQADWLPCDMSVMVRLVEDGDIPDGHNVRLTAEESELVWKHLPLVRKHASRLARHSRGGFGRHGKLTFGFAKSHGTQILQEQVRRWDRTRGVTFGKFVEKRVEGAMKDYIDRMPKTEHLDTTEENYGMLRDNARERERWEVDGRTWRRKKAREIQYAAHSAPVTVPRLLIRRNGPDPALRAAIERLNPKQRRVYEGRVLTNPPVPRSQLAREIDEYETNIPRIERQAREKVAKFMK